ncbi:unnamed protein product [Fusarium venenatum]|uniref:Uncharacterized protein n=1 Tax=Fusarium venenatum TaxID=56646 RepID=A0A2L2SR12_9HYPO|nr:uncharacterized protein FVRRES_12171 [Fusarium venenatum]CEI39480.1 unnamed protein product [Fusarium venenatum]
MIQEGETERLNGWEQVVWLYEKAGIFRHTGIPMGRNESSHGQELKMWKEQAPSGQEFEILKERHSHLS